MWVISSGYLPSREAVKYISTIFTDTQVVVYATQVEWSADWKFAFFSKRATSAHQKIMKIAARDAPSQKAISYCKSFRLAFLRINKTSEGTYLSL